MVTVLRIVNAEEEVFLGLVRRLGRNLDKRDTVVNLLDGKDGRTVIFE